MSDAHLNKAALRLYHTGAAFNGDWQGDPADSLGAYCSSTVVRSLEAQRRKPHYGLRIIDIGGSNGMGQGIIRALSADSLCWIPPGETAEGEEVTIAEGETLVLPWANGSGDYSKWIIVERVVDSDFSGDEIVTLVDVEFNALGGPVYINEADDQYTYGFIAIRNEGTADATAVAITTSNTWLYFDAFTPTADAVELLSDWESVPSGASWTQSETGITIAAGEWLGLAIRRKYTSTIGMYEGEIAIAYTCDGESNLTATTRGITWRGKESYAEYQLYVTDTEPIDFDAAAQDTAAAWADLTYTGAHGGPWYWQILERDKFGNRTPIADINERIEAGVENPPSAPQAVTVLNVGDGTVSISALYIPIRDTADQQADQWNIYSTYDGTDPDPAADTPAVEAMSGTSLSYATSVQLDDTPVNVIVRTARAADSAESENTDIFGATVEYWFAWNPAPRGGMNASRFQHIVTALPDTPVYIDESENVFWTITGKAVELWADTICVWRLTDAALLTTFERRSWTPAGVGAAAGAELGTWDVGEKTIWLNVGPAFTHAMKIDCLNSICYVPSWRTVGTPHAKYANQPAWPCHAHTCLQLFDAATGQWKTKISGDANGVWTSNVMWRKVASL